MQWIDTHAHLYLKAFAADRPAVMQRAQEAGVGKIYLPNIDASSIGDMLQLESDHPEQCRAMMGLHPCSVNDNVEADLNIIRQWLEQRKFCAVGEIGLDYYWDLTFKEQQVYAFATQIEMAKAQGIPIVIHSRNATRECIDIVREKQDGNLRGIFHCFSGTPQEAKEIIELNFLLGIGGVLTFKRSGLDEVICDIGLQHIVLETDAPYLAPVPHRGKRNESSYIPLIGEKLAAVKGISLQQVAEITTRNAEQLYEK